MSIDARERERRRALVRAHYAVENQLDLDRIMATFSPSSELVYNRQSFPDLDGIRAAHAYMGFSAAGAFRDLKTLADATHFTDDEVVIEGRMCGTHVGEFQGFAPTGRDVEMPFVAFYRFDAAGGLVSERVVMNLAPLAPTPG